jgi:O-antigen ligase
MNRFRDVPLYLTGAAAVCTVVSIAAFEILLGLALAAMLITRHRWRMPPVWLPFSLFVAGTLVSLAASGHIREGFPQVKKFYVYLMLFLVASTFRSVRQIRCVALGWALAAALSSAWSLNQFFNKYEDAQDAHQDFYRAYVGDRITGFTDHWMTFSGEMMTALLVIAAVVFFSTDRKWTGWLIGVAALISVALVLAETRSIWLATAAGGAYLIWFWKRWALIALPAMAGIVLLANPFGVGDRALSIFRPNGELDSNAHRSMTRRIGFEMIKAHPWLGIGPEQVGHQYLQYLPPGTHLPLPVGYYGHLHNIYVHYAAELGVPTMLAMVWMLLRPLYDFARALLRLPESAENRWVLHAAIAVLIAALISGYFEKNIGDSEVLGMLMAVIGCGYVAASESEAKPIP